MWAICFAGWFHGHSHKPSPHFHTACSPFQFALSTRAGTEAVVHSLSAITELHPTRTILSIDGIGAYDNISRASMLNGLAAVPEAHGCLPFAQMWYARPSEYVWHDDSGQPHAVTQAEGGEQGDPLMPADNTQPWKQWPPSYNPARPCMRSLMMCTQLLSPTVSDLFTTCWRTTCMKQHASDSTAARHAFGTKPGTSPQIQRTWSSYMGGRPILAARTARHHSTGRTHRERRAHPVPPPANFGTTHSSPPAPPIPR